MCAGRENEMFANINVSSAKNILLSKDFTFGVQHARYVQVLFGDVESGVQVLQRIVLGEFVVIDEIGSMTMYKSAESQTVLETETEIASVKKRAQYDGGRQDDRDTYLRWKFCTLTFLYGAVLR